jgi:hypothetical protein
MSSTPILDLESALPQPRTGRWIGLLVGIPLGVLLGLSSGTNLRYLPNLNGFLFLPALYVAIAIHEIGHLVFGAVVDMPPGALIVGGVVIFKSGERWLVRFDPRCMFGGLAKVLPSTGNFRRSSFAWMIAGGPVASVALTVATWGEFALHGRGTLGWIGSIFWAGLLTIIASLFPFSSGINKSDGACLWTLMRRPEQLGPWAAVLALQAEETRGVVPRDWDEEVFNRMLMAETFANEYAYVQLLAFYRFADRHQEEEALRHLENALTKSARCGKRFRQCLFLEAAWSSADVRRNVAQARTWLDRTGKVQKPLSTNSVEAAIAIREKRYDDARRYLTTMRNDINRRKLDSGLARFAKEKIAEYEQICERAIATSDTRTTSDSQ